jgi:hypothetical protein
MEACYTCKNVVEVLHKLYKPFLVTEEVEECHHKPHATIGQSAKKWHFHKLTLALHNNLIIVICHDMYLFPERKTSVPSQQTNETSNLSLA